MSYIAYVLLSHARQRKKGWLPDDMLTTVWAGERTCWRGAWSYRGRRGRGCCGSCCGGCTKAKQDLTMIPLTMLHEEHTVDMSTLPKNNMPG